MYRITPSQEGEALKKFIQIIWSNQLLIIVKTTNLKVTVILVLSREAQEGSMANLMQSYSYHKPRYPQASRTVLFSRLLVTDSLESRRNLRQFNRHLRLVYTGGTLPNQACWSPWTSMARPKSASLTAAPLALLARRRFSGCKREKDEKGWRRMVIMITHNTGRGHHTTTTLPSTKNNPGLHYLPITNSQAEKLIQINRNEYGKTCPPFYK